MAEENKELGGDSQNPEGSTDESSSEETSQQNKDESQSEVKDSDYWKKQAEEQSGRAVRAEKTLKEKQEEIARSQEGNKPKDETDKRPLDAREYAKLLNSGYSDDDIDFVENYMKSTGKSAKETLEVPHVKKALEGIKSEKESEQATPSPSKRISSTQTAEGKPIKDLPESERAKHRSFQTWKQRKASK